MGIKIAIVGAGPSGCALAILLKKRNIDCIVFDDNIKPDLIVGESLVSAVIPILRELGVEEKVAAISTLKHGAALRHKDGTRIDFSFQKFGSKFPAYSYNIPRPAFDHVMREHAESLGIKFVDKRAKLEVSDSSSVRDIQLSEESLNDAGINREQQPDLLVDATGRRRLISKTLGIATKKGKRNDVSYFAHYTNFDSDAVIEGQVVLSVIDGGWSWQIPVNKALSVGVVINKDLAKQYGNSAEERLETAIEASQLLASSGAERKRVSAVKSYSNYQLISEKGFGKGWVLLGDSLGFVDPMLSPGVFMGLESAVMLDKILGQSGFADSAYSLEENPKFKQLLNTYFDESIAWHTAWDELIEYFYDGRLLALADVREDIQKNAGRFSLARLIEPKVTRVLSSLVSGIRTKSALNRAILKYSCEHLLKDKADRVPHYAMNQVTVKPEIKNDSIVDLYDYIDEPKYKSSRNVSSF